MSDSERYRSDPYPIVVDGLMCEDIRMGIIARQEFAPAGGFRMYRHRVKKGPWMSFSSHVLEVAGGFRKFLEEWEEDPNP